MFLSETWLKPSDIHNISNEIRNLGYWSVFKSSVDPEIVLEGRPDSRMGFICKKVPGLTYIPLHTKNNRISAIQVKDSGKIQVTIIGVYMPYFSGSANQITEYSQTLEDVQCIIDNNDPLPIIFLGDMNASLPQKSKLC